MKRKNFIIALALLFIVPIIIHTVFYLPAFCEWAEAKEIEGSIITYVGTVTLGLVSLYQTIKANKVSSDLISIQKSKDTPAVIITKFIGVSRDYKLTTTESFHSDEMLTGIIEGRDKDNNVEIFYSIDLFVDDNFDKNKKSFIRVYEIHFENCSQQTISSFTIKRVSFQSTEEEIHYDIPNFPNISLPVGSTLRLMFFMFSNHDFLIDSSASNVFIQSSKIVFDTAIGIIGNETPFHEIIVLTKHLVKKPEAEFNLPLTEKMVSVFIDMKEV